MLVFNIGIVYYFKPNMVSQKKNSNYSQSLNCLNKVYKTPTTKIYFAIII